MTLKMNLILIFDIIFFTTETRIAKLLHGGHLRSSSLAPFLSTLIVSQGVIQIDSTWLVCLCPGTTLLVHWL